MGESQSLKKDKWILSGSEGERLSHPHNLGNGLRVLNLSYRVQRRFNDGKDHNTPLPNMPLWQKDYFELKAIEKQQTQEKHSALPTCLKAGHKFAGRRLPSLYQEGESTLITGEGVSRPR